MRPARLQLLIVLVLAPALVGCGEDRGSGPAVTTTPRTHVPAGGRTVAVSLTEYRLTPASPRITRTGTITFDAANDGDVSHALAVEGPVEEARTRALRPGQRATIELTLPSGSYKWYCPLGDHERRGMTGAVAVGE